MTRFRHPVSAACLAGAMIAATPALSVTLDFSDGSFDAATSTITFNDPAGLGGSLTIAPINGTGLNTFNTANNGTVGAGTSAGGSINLAADLPTVGGVTIPNIVDLGFTFRDMSGAPRALEDVSLGFYDIDFGQGEFVSTLSPASIVLTDTTDLTLVPFDFSARVVGSPTINVPNPTDFDNLTEDQQNASVRFDFGDVDSFGIRLGVTEDQGGTGRNFLFGNLEFTVPTTSTPFTPIPLPLPAMMLGTALIGLAGMRALRRS